MNEEIRKIVSEDQDTKDLNLDDNELYIAYQYILQRDSNTISGFIPKLVQNPNLNIIYVPTKEKIEEDLTRNLRRNLEIFESEIYIADVNLKDFEVSDELQERAFNYVLKFLDNKDAYMKGMYLYGPYGVGKSFLLQGLAKELVKRHQDVVYVFMPDLIRNIRASIGDDSLEKRINILKRTDCLILDDLGGENMTSWFRDEVLLPVIHYRLNANLPVFISSNYKLSELSLKLLSSKEEASDQTGRLIRRINELTERFRLDKRYKKD